MAVPLDRACCACSEIVPLLMLLLLLLLLLLASPFGHVAAGDGCGLVGAGLNPGLIRTNIRHSYLGKDSWTTAIVEPLIGW